MVQIESQPIPAAAPPALSPSANFFGRVAVLNGLITQAQLDECLRVQERLKGMGLTKRLGEILVEKNYLSQEQLRDLLELQHHRALSGQTMVIRAALPESVGARLGDLLLENHLLSKPLLDECLGLQKQLRGMGVQMRLGDILHQRGYLKPEVVACVLRLQRARLNRSSLHRKLVVIGSLCAASLLVAAVSIVRSIGAETAAPGPAPRKPLQVTRKQPATTPPAEGVRVGTETAPVADGGHGAPAGRAGGPSTTAVKPPPTEQELIAQRLAEEARIRRLEKELFPEDHTDETGPEGDPVAPGH